MEKIAEVLKYLIPDFKGDKIIIGALFMLFIIIFSLSYLFFKYILSCTFSNPFLNIMWAICTFALSMALICFLSAYKDYLKKQIKIKKDKENLLFILNHCTVDVIGFFKEFIKQNSDTIITTESQHNILNYLRLRDIDIQYLGENYYKITKEQFEILKEYFRK